MSPSRGKNRRYIIDKQFIRENDFAEKALADISAYDVDTFFTQKIQSGYSSSYIRDMYKLLNPAFDQAVRWKLIKENPAGEADIPSVQHKKMEIWESPEEMYTFLEAAKVEKLYIFFLLGVTTGARRGELLGLKWGNIDLIEGTMRIRRSLTRQEGIGLEFGLTKSEAGDRMIGLSQEVIEELRRHKVEQDAWKHSIKDEYQDHDLVVCTPLGKPMDPRNTNRVMERIIKKSGVKRIRLHDMRHTHASHLIAGGLDAVSTAHRMGHRDPAVTLSVYSKPTDKEDQGADVFQTTLNQGRPQKI